MEYGQSKQKKIIIIKEPKTAVIPVTALAAPSSDGPVRKRNTVVKLCVYFPFVPQTYTELLGSSAVLQCRTSPLLPIPDFSFPFTLTRRAVLVGKLYISTFVCLRSVKLMKAFLAV